MVVHSFRRKDLLRKKEVFLENIRILQCASNSWGSAEKKRGQWCVENLLDQIYEIDLAIAVIDKGVIKR